MVQIHCVDEGGNVCVVEMETTALVEDLQAVIEVELGIPMVEQRLVTANNRILFGDETLAAQGLVTETHVTVHRYREDPPPPPPPPAPAAAAPAAAAAAAQPQMQQGLLPLGGRQHIPLDHARELIENIFAAGATRQPQHINENDPEFQRRLYETIQQRNVEENLENALEFAPEVFGQVTMLYVNCEVNNVKLKAFVDTGAQVSVMNARTAERCGLMRLLDKRMMGVVRGVGEQQSLGRIHMAVVKIGDLHLALSLCVLENQQIDFILGLDQMKRHHMIVDLGENCLHISGTTVPFLPEAELPSYTDAAAGSKDSEEVVDVQERHSKLGDDAAPPAQPAAPVGVSVGATDAPHTEATEDVIGADKKTAVSALMSLTGVGQERAVLLLEATGWNVDVAVSLLLDE